MADVIPDVEMTGYLRREKGEGKEVWVSLEPIRHSVALSAEANAEAVRSPGGGAGV